MSTEESRQTQPTRIAGLFPPEVETYECDPDHVAGEMLPAERRCVARAVEKRRREFLAGRIGARSLMGRLGVKPQPVLVGPFREPLWPEGITGSIAHTAGYCAVALARKGRILSLGIDAERISRMRPETWRLIGTPDELESAKAAIGDEMQRMAVIFSAKECFYKCQHPVTRKWLGFRDVSVKLSGEGSFSVSIVRKDAPVIPARARFDGRFTCFEDCVVTGMSLIA